MIRAWDAEVGRTYYRAGMFAAMLCQSPNLAGHSRAEIYSHVMDRAERHRMSHPTRRATGFWAFQSPRRYLIHASDERRIMGTLGVQCWICGEHLPINQWSADIFSRDASAGRRTICERCKRVPERKLYEISGIAECGRLIKSLSRGEQPSTLGRDMHMKTTADLRDSIIKDLALLKSGDITRAEARTRAYLAKQIIDTVKTECVAMSLGSTRLEPVSLGQ